MNYGRIRAHLQRNRVVEKGKSGPPALRYIILGPSALAGPKMEPVIRIELMTPRLQGGRSAAELHRHGIKREHSFASIAYDFNGVKCAIGHHVLDVLARTRYHLAG